MIKICKKDGQINHFRGLSADVTSNKHLPDSEGKLDGVKLRNGDELYCFDNGDTHIYDEENVRWWQQ